MQKIVAIRLRQAQGDRATVTLLTALSFSVCVSDEKGNRQRRVCMCEQDKVKMKINEGVS